MQTCSDRAWNNFVMLSEPHAHEPGSPKRAAAVASLFMAVANNGGLNAFLTSTWDLDAEEVVRALGEVGAGKAQQQLAVVLQRLGVALPTMTQEERWTILEERWPEDLDAYDDCLSEAADSELIAALREHVAAHEAFYTRLT